MNEDDQLAIEMLGNLIANIKQGNLHVIATGGYQISETVAEVTFRMDGAPDAKLRLEGL